MSIHFVSGKPGAGKSFYGVKLAFEELRYGTRHIVTNLPLLVGELNAYYQEHYGEDSGLKKYRIPWWLPKFAAGFLFWYLPEALSLKVFPLSPDAADNRMRTPRADNITERIHLISDEEMAVFFTKRPGSTIAHVSKEEWRQGVRPDYSVVKDGGVFFILDEVHIPFNSRAWAETGAEVLYYLSQHRKLGDDVIAITQAVTNVDKQFRSVAQDFTYIRNLAKETFGHFRLPARFIRKTYSQPPTGDKSEPMEMGSFTLDINGLAKCYDTAKGVGIHGRAGADKKQRKKGIHWLWFAIGLPVVCWTLFHFIPIFFVRFFHTPTVQVKHSAPAQSPKPGQTDPPALPSSGYDIRRQDTNAVINQATEKPLVVCNGWFVSGQNITVFMSDGNSYESQYGEVTAVSRHTATVNGTVYQVVPTKLPEYQPPAYPASQPQPYENASQYQTQTDNEGNVHVTYIGQSHRNGNASNPRLGAGIAAGFSAVPTLPPVR